MKYLVELSFTNPSHEHVSLRRRVERVTRVVEATSEDQAILRATSQQRALGFFIKEAKVVKEKEEVVDNDEKTAVASAGKSGNDKETERMQKKLESGKMSPSDVEKKLTKEGFDTDPADIAAYLVNRHGKGKVTMDHIEACERRRDSHRPIEKHEVMKHVQKMAEEVEQVDEANMRFDPEAAARPKSSDVKNFLNRDKNPRAAAASKKYIRRMTKLGGLGPNQTKKDTEAHMKAYFEEVEQNVAEGSEKNKAYTQGEEAGKKSHRAENNPYKSGSPEHREWEAGRKGTIPDRSRFLPSKKGVAEEVEQVDEGYKDASGPYKKFSGVGKPAKQPLLGKEGSRRKGHIRDIVQSLQLMDASKPISADHHAKILSKLDRLKEEVELDEASKEGKDVMRNMRAGLKSMDLRHGVDSDKRDAGYKMSPAVKAAQAKSDALSKVVKRPQAGTIAAVHRSMERQMQKESVEYIEEKLTAADPASKWISDFVKSDNPKFAGKSKKERIQMALGAHYAAKRGE